MDPEIVEFLNALGEAERAGGRVLHALEQEASSLEFKELLRKTAHDEGYYAGQIGAHIRRLSVDPDRRFRRKGSCVKRSEEQDRAAQPRPALGNPQNRGA